MTTPRAHTRPGLHRSAAVTALAGALATWLPACSNGPKPTARQVQVQTREVPALLRGTVGAEVEFRGIQPVLVSGYGLVVGLNGTGGDVLPDAIAATMEREMGLRGIGKANDEGGEAFANKSPREILRDKNVAVVLVQAAIPPGAPANATFDVFVQAINASDLEGGQLFSTDLRIGEASTFGRVQARRLAEARGPIFINPFDRPEAGGTTESAVGARVTGRVLAGGQVSNPLGIELVLLNPSFQRTRAIVSAINSRFPGGPGDPVPTARGRSGPDANTGTGGSVELHVPNRFRQNPADFLQLIRHVQIEQQFPEQYARKYVEGMKAEPVLADELAWCLEALGNKSLPFVREIYDFPEQRVQLAALRTGARLDDPLAAPHLKEVIQRRSGSTRNQAIALLGQVNTSGPGVDETLRDLLAEHDLDVRVAAYEALAGRAERIQFARLENLQKSDESSREARLSPTALQILASRSLSGRTMQGVDRAFIADKFFLDVVPVGEPLIYVSQQGQPRVVLFGEQNEMKRPVVVSAWDNRLMMTAEGPGDSVRVYYRPMESDRPIQQTVKADLPRVIEFMARKTTPEDPRPGLDFTYSQVVGALSALQLAGGTRAAFATESDRLKLELNAAPSAATLAQRPETPGDRELRVVQPRTSIADVTPDPSKAPPKIVPIVPAGEEEKKKARAAEAARVKGN